MAFSFCKPCSEASQTLLIAESDFWTLIFLGSAQRSLIINISITTQFRSCLVLTQGVVLGLIDSIILLQRGFLLFSLLSIQKSSPIEKHK